MDKKTGFVKRPTFAELAQLEQKVTYSKPIIRDATAYWNSFDSAWLKGPLDEVSNRAFLAQQRRAPRAGNFGVEARFCIENNEKCLKIP